MCDIIYADLQAEVVFVTCITCECHEITLEIIKAMSDEEE